MRYVLARQDYFELIPSRSTIYNLFGASLGALLDHFPDQTGFFIDLNVFASCVLENKVAP